MRKRNQTGDLIKQSSGNTFWAKIYVAGNVTDAKRICREYCNEVGLCVNVSKTDYIYTAGAQSGVVVELINYPKFSSAAYRSNIYEHSYRLAGKLVNGLYQKSCTIMYPDKTDYFEHENHIDSNE